MVFWHGVINGYVYVVFEERVGELSIMSGVIVPNPAISNLE